MKVTMLGQADPRPRRVAVGEFDGVHLGHREVIRGSDTVLTFEPHPLRVLRPEAAPKLLTSLETKAELVERLGVEELVVIPFDHAFAAVEAPEFVDRVLVEALCAEQVSVGENFRFGHRAGGDTAMLEADPRFRARVVPMVEIEGQIVSSSHIRALVLSGDVEGATRFLGHPFLMTGEVVHGEKRGRTLGFPTANLVPDDAYVCPGHGVYAARADGAPACVSVGVRPTFGAGKMLLAEVYLLDFTGDLYGRSLQIEYVRRLRGERRFDSAEALVEQMHRDVAQTRELLASRPDVPDPGT